MTQAPHHASDELRETVISSESRVRAMQSLRDLWEYRDLFRAFVGRDLKVRYKQTALGVIWVVLQPLMAGGVFAMVFRNLGVQPELTAFQMLLFYMAGLVPWNTFSSAVMTSSASMESNANLVSKVYFPRLVVPGAYVCGSVVDYSISITVWSTLTAVAGCFNPLMLAMLPVCLLIQVMAAAGLGFIFAVLNAQYRDVKYVVPFMLMIGLFVTVPTGLDAWGATARQFLSFNPMAAPIETYRALLMDKPIDFLLIAKGAATSTVLFASGIWFFRFREARLVDIL